VGIDRQPRPRLEILTEPVGRRLRLQAEGVAAEVDDRGTVGAWRDVETIAAGRQRILAIEAQGVPFVGRERLDHR
jgi:hypothetical protein